MILLLDKLIILFQNCSDDIISNCVGDFMLKIYHKYSIDISFTSKSPEPGDLVPRHILSKPQPQLNSTQP